MRTLDKNGKGCMIGFAVSLLALVLLSGCETLNDAFVRRWFKDPSLSRRVNSQIREGLEKRKGAAPGTVPRPAPAFMDQG